MSDQDDLVSFFNDIDTDIEDILAGKDPEIPSADEADDDEEEEEEVYVFDCPGCGQSLAVDAESLGLEMECPQCAISIRIPGEAEIPPSPDEPPKEA